MVAGQGSAQAEQAAERPGYGTTGLYETIEHPELSAITPTAIIQFREARQAYIRRIESKNREAGVDIRPVEMKDSIPISRLQSMIFMKMIPAERVQDVTNNMVEEFLTEYARRSGAVIETKAVDKAIKSVAMNMAVADARGRVMSLIDDYLSALRKNGYESYPNTHVESAIRHIQDRLKPVALRARLELDFKIQPELRKKSFHDYVTRVVERAVACDAFSDPNLATTIEALKKDKGKERASPRTTDKKDGDSKKRKFGARGDLPKCLYEPCKKKGYRHYIRDCKFCPESEKEKLLQEYKANKRQSYNRIKIRRVEAKTGDELGTEDIQDLVTLDGEHSSEDIS